MMTRRALLAAASSALALGIDTREPAPKFKAKTLDGEQFDNASIQGKIVLLQFWATWCKYCRSDQPAVDAIVREFTDQGLIVLGVDVGESKKKVKQYLDAAPRACKIVLTEDTNLAAMYAAKSYPLYVLIDRNGKIAGEQRGAAGEAALRRLLRKAGLDQA
ncbi:MAG TPA: TlpA disulfide reductase family protein [Bryobacteraceae bacterium]|nr:TlpA disulfide reductase family protein [Bryobacteraceae bacterium]